MRSPKTIILSLFLLLLLGCEKELPNYEAPKEKYRKQINEFLKGFFQTNPAIRQKEPAAGLWVAEEKSLKQFVEARFMKEQSEDLSKKVVEERLKKIRMFMRISVNQLLMVMFNHNGDLSPPQEGRFNKYKTQGALRYYRGSFRPQMKDGKEQPPHKFKFNLKSVGVGQELVFEDGGNTVKFRRENTMPIALYDKYHQSSEKMKQTVEF